MFRGGSSIAIDAKGRIGIPSRYRDRLNDRCEGNLVITVALSKELDRHRGLAAYPLPDWEAVERKLREELPSFDSDAQDILTLLSMHAHECTLDAQGRVPVPPSLRQLANLGKRVMLVGKVNRFELWNEEVWNARSKDLFASVGKIMAAPSPALRDLVL